MSQKVGTKLTLKLGSTLSQDDLLNIAIGLEKIPDLLLSGAKGKVANEDRTSVKFIARVVGSSTVGSSCRATNDTRGSVHASDSDQLPCIMVAESL